MTDQQHPITPPPELVEQWRTKPEFAEPGHTTVVSMTQSRLRYIAAQAARWGADQELKACCSWVSQFDYDDYSYGDRLRAARRGRTTPPSLKEQALGALYAIATGADDTREFYQDLETIKSALEQLDD